MGSGSLLTESTSMPCITYELTFWDKTYGSCSAKCETVASTPPIPNPLHSARQCHAPLNSSSAVSMCRLFGLRRAGEPPLFASTAALRHRVLSSVIMCREIKSFLSTLEGLQKGCKLQAGLKEAKGSRRLRATAMGIHGDSLPLQSAQTHHSFV